MLSVDEWHQRFSQQAEWTASVRKYLIDKFALHHCTRCLEVGCGTGAVLEEIKNSTKSHRFGIDIDQDRINYAQSIGADASLGIATAEKLPFSSQSFDFTFCHFLLLWVADPVRVLKEMMRVTRPGGWVLAFAEPDYSGRLDYPPELQIIGNIQKESLALQGANPEIGRSLCSLFQRAGLEEVRMSILGGEWGYSISEREREMEWRTVMADWEFYAEKTASCVTRSEIEHLKIIDRQACQQGERLIFVPTFFAWGRVP